MHVTGRIGTGSLRVLSSTVFTKRTGFRGPLYPGRNAGDAGKRRPGGHQRVCQHPHPRHEDCICRSKVSLLLLV